MRVMASKIGMALAVILLLASCKKDKYKNDGGTHDPHVNMTTYDYLKQHGSFDSLVKAIDMAGLKDAINGDVTFFAVTNWGVRDWMLAKKQQKIIEVGSENIVFGMKDVSAAVLKDSLRMYIFPGKIQRENLNTKGAYFTSLIGPMGSNIRQYIKLRRITPYNNYLEYVDYVNFTKVIGTLDADELDFASIPNALKDVTVDCQTSGIITTTGILHVLDNRHRLFFNTEPLPK